VSSRESPRTAGPGARRWGFRVDVEQVDGIPVMTCTGRIGHAAAADFSRALHTATAEGRMRLVIDFTGVDYISSAGLNALRAFAKRAKAAGDDIALCGLCVAAKLAFDLADLLPEITISETRQEAVARLSGCADPWI